MKARAVLALGADTKSRFLIEKDRNIRFGPEIGDLGIPENYERFEKEVKKAVRGVSLDRVAYDLHPGYFSARFALAYFAASGPVEYPKHSRKRPRLIPVQHHHAHIASVLEEHSLKNPVIGICFDGTGFGADGKMWGGEFILADKTGFKRLAHFEYMKMPGVEKVIREPWRMALSLMGNSAFPLIKDITGKYKRVILSMCEKNINTPLTSSVGRIFDAAAALLGICSRASYEAEGPIKLEQISASDVKEGYGFDTIRDKTGYVIRVKKIFLGMAGDLRKGKKKYLIAAKFHNSVVNAALLTVKRLSKDTGIKNVAVSGGVFQNKIIKTRMIKKLNSAGFAVYANDKMPANDFNISLGQYHISRYNK
ncbi:MAG: carbamoyltransferase HypF [Candidatus Omnitrophica bacterium]|nr:carbamoyltransferase HypF [Candidatus Omnitrophota bacterium]